MKRARLNLLLLIGVVMLAAIGWWTRERPEVAAPLTALQPEAVQMIRIAHAGRPDIVLHRRDHGWQITAPVDVEADALEVQSLLNLTGVPVRRSIADAAAGELGLEPPAFVISLDDTAIAFGEIEPISAQRFVAVNGRLALIDNPPSSALDDDYSDLVGKQLVPVHDPLVAIRLPSGERVEQHDGTWRVLGRPDIDAAPMAEGWSEARAMWNAAALTVESDGLDVFTLTLASGAERRYAVARRAPQFELIQLDAAVQHTVSAALADTLLVLPVATDSPEAPTSTPVAAPAD